MPSSIFWGTPLAPSIFAAWPSVGFIAFGLGSGRFADTAETGVCWLGEDSILGPEGWFATVEALRGDADVLDALSEPAE